MQLIKENEVSTSSPLASLRPFFDEHGIIRVVGQLQKARLQLSQKHPIILHHKDRLSHLILQNIHNTDACRTTTDDCHIWCSVPHYCSGTSCSLHFSKLCYLSKTMSNYL